MIVKNQSFCSILEQDFMGLEDFLQQKIILIEKDPNNICMHRLIY